MPFNLLKVLITDKMKNLNLKRSHTDPLVLALGQLYFYVTYILLANEQVNTDCYILLIPKDELLCGLSGPRSYKKQRLNLLPVRGKKTKKSGRTR